MGYKHPTKIQKETLPYALKGQDIIGLAETGSGKTAAFGLPIIQKLLLEQPMPFYACVLAPTRELCLQINQHLLTMGAGIGLKTSVLVGGLDMVSQAISLSKNPHIVIGTPGRVVDHLTNTKGFNLKNLKFLVFDEADRLLDLDFEKQINQLLAVIPKKRSTFLFSATMTSKVHKLQKASLSDPVKIEINSKYQTVSGLVQNYVFIPAKYKETYLAYILHQYSGNTIIIFVEKCLTSIQ
jgi:ATP-dependent RNA helicase DDX47/RRP3